MIVDVLLSVFQEDLDDSRETECLFQTIGEARCKTEVNVRRLDKASIQQSNNAQTDEIEQWIADGIVSICDEASVLVNRIMSVRWIASICAQG